MRPAPVQAAECRQPKNQNESQAELVSDPFLRLPAVCLVTGYRRASIYSFIKANRFPAPVRLARASLWPRSQVEAWIECVRRGEEWRSELQAGRQQ